MNKSTKQTFDPSPAANPFFSHELLVTLMDIFPELRSAWIAGLSSATSPETNTEPEDTSSTVPRAPRALDGIASLYAQGRGEQVTVAHHWLNIPIAPAMIAGAKSLGGAKARAARSTAAEAERWSRHKYDQSRMINDMCDSFSVEDRGVPREW